MTDGADQLHAAPRADLIRIAALFEAASEAAAEARRASAELWDRLDYT